MLLGFEGSDTGFTGDAREDILNMSAVHPIREETMVRSCARTGLIAVCRISWSVRKRSEVIYQDKNSGFVTLQEQRV